MRTFNAKGLVLKETLVGEADKILTVLLKERGKVSVSAKGARKTGSKFLFASQVFCYCDYVIYTGGKYYSIASAQFIDNFYGISSDYDKLCIGAYLLELTDKVIMENQDCDDILYLLLKTLKTLEKGTHCPELIRCAYELKFLQLNGYSPEVSVCADCGSAVNENIFFNHFGLICQDCAQGSASQISPGCLHAVRYILSQEINKLFSFTINEKTLSELKNITKGLFDMHMGVKLKSAQFIG